MDILIKNMEMPKEGNVFLIISEDGCVSERIGNMWHVTTEAIELPEHGRLIDADALSDRIEHAVYPDALAYTIAVGIIQRELREAPVIVEATE